jgi:hypothetical protein
MDDNLRELVEEVARGPEPGDDLVTVPLKLLTDLGLNPEVLGYDEEPV